MNIQKTIPTSLKTITPDPHWVVWKWENRRSKSGEQKPTKPPLMVKHGRPCGYAHNNKPQTWTSLQAAQEAAHYADGIGLQLLGLSGIAALDLDDVRGADGTLLPWAADLVRRSSSYSEFTPSGRGARIIGKVPADHPTLHTKKDHPGGGHFEIYANLTEGHGRYITVTGDRIDGAPDALVDITQIVTELMQIDREKESDKKPNEQFSISLNIDTGNPYLPGWVQVYLDGRGTDDRSKDFQSIVNALRPRGWSFEAALKLFEDHPHGPGAKYADRLESELRRSWDKATAPSGQDAPPADANTDWPAPDAKFLRPEIPSAPELPLDDVFGPRFTKWAKDAAEAKGAPPDYVVFSVLSVLSSVIGNTRWVSPWRGWTEPPVIWAMLIGLPSAGKSPAIDAVLCPLREVERPLRDAANAKRREWNEQAEVAKLAESAWKGAVKAAIDEGKTSPDRPKEADAGSPPHIPRLVLNDATIERLGAILANQPRGTLQMRDELSG